MTEENGIHPTKRSTSSLAGVFLPSIDKNKTSHMTGGGSSSVGSCFGSNYNNTNNSSGNINSNNYDSGHRNSNSSCDSSNNTSVSTGLSSNHNGSSSGHSRRQRAFSFTNYLVNKTRRAYSVSSADTVSIKYKPLLSLPSHLKSKASAVLDNYDLSIDNKRPFLSSSNHRSSSSSNNNSNQNTVMDEDRLSFVETKRLTPAQRRNSIAAQQRKYADFEQKIEAAPLFVLVTTYLNYLVLILFGHLRDFAGKIFKRDAYAHLRTNEGYAPLVSDFDSFYTRRMYIRIRDCWNRPITGVPGRTVTILERESKDFNKTFHLTGRKISAINFSSYNYLGFAQKKGVCADQVEQCVKEYGISSGGSTRMETGTLDLHRELERKVAKFVGKEDAMVISMGFATNSTTIPSLVSKGCLVISDELNHSSIIFGVRLSGASVRVFKHNNMIDLRNLLREVISQGQPRTHRPWKKIIVIVEGLYSMEGSILNLPELINLKNEFKFYLYVDEAHSIGALGESGGGVCDFYGINPRHVDILMGTFTKSFGAAGGYIAGDRAVIDHLRAKNHAFSYAEGMTPPILQQVSSSMDIILGEDGTNNGVDRIHALAENARYFASALRRMGFIVYGDEGSPVIPLLLFNPAKIS
ncbi:pyridoxal phosphate-dependent transferase [Mycotypha africana]|uniref:pyridoxal phosphate-dependent transferase n=1 Tax=Mycotypha africana TaxID=64632 RepID=UPI00230149F4|nr:pyridoxal phosphate-dependent transferase [Mycotypha africana]KAI8971449.1 pyridoxal phosphate-dependent transferase [Mycotypha africana]